jgi:integrase
LTAQLRGEPVAATPAPAPTSWTIKHAVSVAEKVAWSGPWGARAAIYARIFQRHVGADAPLDTIDINTLELWTAELEAEGKSDATINRYLAAVSKVFSVAKRRGGTSSRPDIPRRKESQGRVRFLSTEEESALLGLLDQCGKEAERDLIVVLVDTGLRVGEALRLQARDIDFKGGVLAVWKTKNGEPRSVPMTSRVRAIMEKAALRAPAGPLLAVAPHALRTTWLQAKAAMGLTGDAQFVPHALRHTCASRLVQRGVPLKVTQEWLGHRTIAVTLRYAHLAPANLLAAVQVLEPETETETAAP